MLLGVRFDLEYGAVVAHALALVLPELAIVHDLKPLQVVCRVEND